MRKTMNLLMTVAAVLVLGMTARAAVSVDSRLAAQISAAPAALTPVIITFHNRPTAADFNMLRSLGIVGGRYLQELPMVLTRINALQFNALRARSSIKSLYSNRTFRLLDREGRTISGVENLIRDVQVTTQNGGMPVSGRGIGVSYIDTGIDATHPDLQLGNNVVQNVFFATAEVPLELPNGFLPIVPVENQPMTDVEGGHGTFGAAVTAGTGAASAGLYAGMAPGAKLIGITACNDVGLSTYAIVQAMDYTLVNQFRYNIRVCNNSYGTTLSEYPYDPSDPINVGSRMMHDRNITVVFAAGNGISPGLGQGSVGDMPGAINPFSVAPWVMSVGAGEKRGLGTPAGFSSRGEDNGTGTDVAGQPADENAPPNLRPDILGSGVDIKSARSKGPGLTNTAGTIPIFVGANDLTTIPPAYLPYYTTSQGTSFATPQVSGIVALMLEANPLLTPDQVVTILRQTANPMPYTEREVGAGYVDAHNAVRAAMALSPVPPPANLFPVEDPNAPQIIDSEDDQLGTTAQDIREVRFSYDAAADQIVYRMVVTDASVRTPNMRWTMQSTFNGTPVFVTASIDETETTYNYGRLTTLPTGTQNQQTIGAADAGSIPGNVITVRLARNKVNMAVESEVLNTTSTATQARSQILIGTSFTGGLLLNSDAANGSDFYVGSEPQPTPEPTPTPETTPTPEPSPTPTPESTPTPGPEPSPTPAPAPGGGRFNERYSGTLLVGQGQADTVFELRRARLDAMLNHNHGNQQVFFELFDGAGNMLASTSGKTILLDGLQPGPYRYRIRGNVTRAIDFTIKSGQGQ